MSGYSMGEILPEESPAAYAAWLGSISRGPIHFVVAMLLLLANDYGASDDKWPLSLAIGLLAVSLKTLWIAKAAVALLMVMAIITPSAIGAVVGLF